MRIRSHLALILTVALLLLPSAVSAKSSRKSKVWSSKSDSRSGLYSVKNHFVSNSISLNASALYYFGDVDNQGVAFSGGFNFENLSYGGGIRFTYDMPAGNHCNIKFGIMGGTLRGNNQKMMENQNPPRDDYRKFQSYIIQPSVGVQYYPFTNAGFYLYGGLAVTGSIISNFEFWYYKRTGSESVRTLLQGSTYGILPMLQLGLGYSWRLTESWSMGIELMVQEGLVDTHYMNLDAYPLAASQNSEKVDLGSTSGSWVDAKGKKHTNWNDGWFQFGITFTYQWRTCDHCRMLNNYSNIKPQRR